MDQHLLSLINRTWTNPVLDYVMAAVSSMDFWLPFLIILLVVAAIFGSFRTRMMLVAIGLAIGLTDGLVVSNLKKTVGRPRPHEIREGTRTIDLERAKPRFLALGKPLRENYAVARIRSEGGNSFPSAHTANNFAVAAVCAIFYRRRGWLVFIPALLVGYSRIYVGSHWPSDVLISALLGIGLGALVAALVEAVWRHWGKNIAPGLHSRHPSLLTA